MSTDLQNTISCFDHCSKLVFYNKFPNFCPVCKQTLRDFKTQPFQLPSPFKDAQQSPVSIIIRPSRGTFLTDYNVNNDLHIGIVDSQNNIFEYDKEGIVTNDFQTWKHCIAINIVPEAWFFYWDEILKTTVSNPIWTSDNYRQDTQNCFSFVIDFLNKLKYKNVQFSSKEDFCQMYLLPKMNELMRYVKIYRKLSESHVYVQE